MGHPWPEKKCQNRSLTYFFEMWPHKPHAMHLLFSLDMVDTGLSSTVVPTFSSCWGGDWGQSPHEKHNYVKYF